MGGGGGDANPAVVVHFGGILGILGPSRGLLGLPAASRGLLGPPEASSSCFCVFQQPT